MQDNGLSAVARCCVLVIQGALSASSSSTATSGLNLSSETIAVATTAAVIPKRTPQLHSRRPAQASPWHSMRMVVRVIPFELFDKTSSVRVAVNNEAFQISDFREILQAFQGYTRAQRRVVGSTS